MKRILSVLLCAVLALGVLAGCSTAGNGGSATPKDYAQIIHDARSDERNEAMLILSSGEDGAFNAMDGYSAEMDADMLRSEAQNLVLPLLGLAEGDYEQFAASVSAMMTQSYAVAIVKPAEGKTEDVKAALESYVEGQRKTMEHYLADQYEIASAATVTVAPTGEVVLVCSENGDAVLQSINAALAA